MSAGWEVGDLALCVDDRDNPTITRPGRIVAGRVYTVVGLDFCSTRHVLYGVSCLGLRLKGMKTSAWGNTFAAERFRKIKPDAHEGELSDWQLILKANSVNHPSKEGVGV